MLWCVAVVHTREVLCDCGCYVHRKYYVIRGCYAHRKYYVARKTRNWQVTFYVKEDFAKAYADAAALNKVESQVEHDYLDNLQQSCYRERNHSRRPSSFSFASSSFAAVWAWYYFPTRKLRYCRKRFLWYIPMLSSHKLSRLENINFVYFDVTGQFSLDAGCLLIRFDIRFDAF